MCFKRQDVAIDLGTATVLFFVRGRNIVLREPSVVAVDTESGELLGVGFEAQKMLGRAPENISVVRPLKDGVISDHELTLQMLQQFMKKVFPHRPLLRPRMIVCVPSGVTDVERRSVCGAAVRLGAKVVHVLEEPRAAAIGANVDIARPSGTMVVDIGGGTTDIAILSLGECVISASLKVAGNKFDEEIVKYMKRKHNLLIGERTAEMLKINIGTAYPRSETLFAEVMGRNLVSNLPAKIVVSSEEIREALHDSLDQIVAAIHNVFDQTPPELSADMIENGIVLTGGGALLFGLDKYISSIFGLNCYVADDAISCVAIGAGKCLDNLALIGKNDELEVDDE